MCGRVDVLRETSASKTEPVCLPPPVLMVTSTYTAPYLGWSNLHEAMETRRPPSTSRAQRPLWPLGEDNEGEQKVPGEPQEPEQRRKVDLGGSSEGRKRGWGGERVIQTSTPGEVLPTSSPQHQLCLVQSPPESKDGIPRTRARGPFRLEESPRHRFSFCLSPHPALVNICHVGARSWELSDSP